MQPPGRPVPFSTSFGNANALSGGRHVVAVAGMIGSIMNHVFRKALDETVPVRARARESGEVDVVLLQAVVRMPGLVDLLRLRLGRVLAAVDAFPTSVEVVETVVFLVDDEDVVDLVERCLACARLGRPCGSCRDDHGDADGGKDGADACKTLHGVSPGSRTARILTDPPSRCGGNRRILERMRICLVTPFAWSQPHDVNDHVAGVARGLRARGHEVTILAPSARAADLLAGRRALTRGERADVIALGAAVPVSRRSQLGRAGRSAGEPRARTRAGTVRRRPRLRARLAVTLLPRPSRHRRARGRDVRRHRTGSATRRPARSARSSWAGSTA